MTNSTAPLTRTPLSARNENSDTLPIAVIGGGPTGLAAAHRIASAGRSVRVFEKAARVGGAVQSVREDDWLVEAGPNSLQENLRELRELWQELGLLDERIVANPAAKKRYIVRAGKLCALPSSPLSLLATSAWSLRSTLRLLGEWRMKPRSRDRDVSIETLFTEHFGAELAAYALNPFVSGIYAGNPQLLSARHAFPKIWQSERTRGSIVRGMMALSKERRLEGHPKTALISFRNGLQTITDALAAKLPSTSIELETEIEAITQHERGWTVTFRRGGEKIHELFSQVILTCPPLALARIPIGGEQRPLELLSQIPYSAVSSHFLGFPRSAVAHSLDGFGLLVPAVEKLKTLGVIFSSSLFPARAPAGMVGLTVMVGGANSPELVGADAETSFAHVKPELTKLLGISGAPVFNRLHVWPRAIPQYQLGYEKFLDCIDQCERNFPGLWIAGNARNGIALSACLEAGLAIGRRVLS